MLKGVTGIVLDPIIEGVVSSNVLSHYVAPEGSISYAENMHNDTLGMMTSRKPFVNRNTPTALAKSCVLYQTPSGSASILWQEGTSMKFADVTGSTITTYAASSSVNKNRYDTIQGKIIMTNDGVGQPKLFDASGAPTAIAGTAFPGAAANCDLISAGFSGRIWAAGSNDAACRVYYSDIIPAAGVASTTMTATNPYLVINANNGDKITGFARTQNVLYVFTHNGIFRIYNTQSQDNTPICNIGAFQQEAIVKAKNGYYFYHPSGIYFIGSNGFPQEISIKIRDMLTKIPPSYQSKVFGWCDDDHVYYCIGNNLAGMQADKTYYVRYTISTQVWTFYSTIGFLPTCGDGLNYANPSAGFNTEDVYPTNYLIGSGLDTNGAVTSTYYGGTFNVFNQSTDSSSVVTDWGTLPINIDVQTQWLTFDLEHHKKRINGIAFPSENGAGLGVAYQTDIDRPNTWKPVAASGISTKSELSANYVTVFRNFQSEKFNRIKFRVYGNTKGSIVKIGSPIMLQVDDLGFDTN